MRRIVTGHSPSGKSVFISDGEPPRVVKMETMPGYELAEIWANDASPMVPAEQADPTVGMSSFIPGPEGTRFRIVRFPSEQELALALPGGIDLVALRQEHIDKIPSPAETYEVGGMHTTDTVDYGIVLSGEIWLELDDGAEVHLKPGDCVVQNGTRHAWKNHGSQLCVMAFVMVGAERRK